MTLNSTKDEDSKELLKLYNKLSKIKQCYDNNQINNLELIMSYIIYYNQYLFPKKWFTGSIKVLESEQQFVELFKDIKDIKDTKDIKDIKDNNKDNKLNLLSLLFDEDDEKSVLKQIENKIRKKDPTIEKIDLIDLFKYSILYKIEDYINQLIYNLYSINNNYIIKIYDYIPSVEEVLNLQCKGRRCVSLFFQQLELTQQFKMEYPPYSKLTAIEFMLHDLQHLNKFLDTKFYYQQIGFFNYIKQNQFILLQNLNRDPHFYPDLAHITSDMNSVAIHSISFLKAKSIASYHRWFYPPPCSTLRLNDLEHEEFENKIWNKFIEPIGDKEKQILNILCSRKLKSEEKDLINDYFHAFGKSSLKFVNGNE
ncbi:hypothetical protein K502DRAFT_328885 [Neoconidiobolus thromboides FSU 785]|nr:hypothetical protein K502DRAFT_328885 [Neoconidiobolus thromboides FSU 785]